jgi:hypothetical protein
VAPGAEKFLKDFWDFAFKETGVVINEVSKAFFVDSRVDPLDCGALHALNMSTRSGHSCLAWVIWGAIAPAGRHLEH